MTVPIFIEPTDGQFSATVAGAPELRCVRPSRAEAIGALESELAKKLQAGELVNLEVGTIGVSSLAGRFQDDPTLQQIRQQIYREREADQQQ
jgi:hypothetical protein